MNLVSIPLSQLAAVHSGGGAPQDAAAFSTTGFPFVRAGSLPKLLDGATEDSLELIKPDVAERHGLRLFPSGTVVFAKSGMSATKGHIYRLKNSAYVVNHLAALIPYMPNDGAFLVRALELFSPALLIKGPGYPSVRLSDIENMRIRAPTSVNDRKWIADLLDKADALRVKRRVALARVDTLTQAIFFDIFGDPATNPKRFDRQQLASLIRQNDTINYGVVQPGDEYSGGIPLIRVGDLQDGKVNKKDLKRISPAIEATYKRSRLRGDEILVSCVGSIGNVALADESVKGFNIARAVARIPLADATDRLFMASYLRTEYVQDYFRSELRTVSQPTLNIKQITETPVILPPISLQREFANRVIALEKLRAAHYDSTAKLNTLFTTFQHRAFQGEF